MKLKKLKEAKTALFFLVVFALAIRMYFAFKTPYFDYESYFGIRQTESIKLTGLPVFSDPLSYGGKTVIFSPLFYYLMAFFNLIVPVQFFLKVISNILVVSIIPLVYLTAKELTKDRNSALFSAFLASIVPILGTTINSLAPFTLILPMMFYIIYCLIRIKEEKYFYQFLIFILVSSLISPLTLLLIPGFWLYLLFLKLEKVKERRTEFEAITFSTFLAILVQFLIYKKAILAHGSLVVWQNIPQQALANYFSNVTVLSTIGAIGLVPFAFGVYRIYKFSYDKKEHGESSVISFILLVALLLWMKIIQLDKGLIFLGIGLSIISGESFRSISEYIEKTHVSNYKNYIFSALLIFIFLASLPSFAYYLEKESHNTPAKAQMEALEWIKVHTDDNTKIVAAPEEGYLISAVAKRANIIDENFLLEKDISGRYGDVTTIFSTNYETEAISLLNKYDAKFIFLSEYEKERFNVTGLSYANERCFKKIYENNTIIYETWCSLNE